MTLKFTILGCGNSTGVPAIGNIWGNCDPAESKNKRLRPSLLVESNDTKLVIDTGPDFYQQMNHANITDLDAVLFTHGHSDHTNGIDELRIYKHRNQKDTIPIYTNHETVLELRRRFYYLFDGGLEDIYPPIVTPHELDKYYGKQTRVGGIDFIPLPQGHGNVTSVGYRFGNTAYCTDMKTLEKSAINTLKGIKTWIVDAAGYHQDSNPVHANLQEIYALNDQIGAQRVILTSLSLSMDYQTLLNELPKGYEPAFDGMEITQ